MRYPAVSRSYFMECSGNGLTDWTKAASTTVQQSHGLLSCAQWTGIPLSTLLDEAGSSRPPNGCCSKAPTARATRARSRSRRYGRRALLVYGQNGEMLRPEQGYPLRAVHPRLGRQRLGQVAAPDQGRRPALALPQRDRALHRPDAGRQVAAVQLRDGVQVRHHQPVRRHEARRAGHLRDPGLRLVGQRHASRRSTSPSTAARPGARRRWRSRSWTSASPASATAGSGTAGRPRSRAAPSTAPAMSSRPSRRSPRSRALVGFVQHHNGIFPWSISASRGGQQCGRHELGSARSRAAGCPLRSSPLRNRRAAARRGTESRSRRRTSRPGTSTSARRTGRGLPGGQGSVAEGKEVYAANARHATARTPRADRLRHHGRRHRIVHDRIRAC